jgi:integrase
MASKPYPDLRRGTWRLKYRPDPTGKWKAVTLGKDPRLLLARPPKTPPQWVIDRAREFEEVEYRARHGMEAAPARARGLESYLAAYADGYAARKDAGSVKQLRRHVRTFLTFAAARGIASVQAVTKADVRDYLEERIKSVSPSTLQTEKGYLSPIWTRAVDDGLMQVNPWKLVKVPGKKVRPKPTFWGTEQVDAIARNCYRPWQGNLVRVLASTGLRISAALAMTWDWISWPRGTLTVPAEHSKGGKPYTISLSRVARGVLERRHLTAGGADLVFPNPRTGVVVPYDSAREAIDRAIRKAGVPWGHPHDLRHSYGRALALAGVPMPIIQAQLGHSAMAMTAIYTEMTESESARFMEEFDFGGGGDES